MMALLGLDDLTNVLVKVFRIETEPISGKINIFFDVAVAALLFSDHFFRHIFHGVHVVMEWIFHLRHPQSKRVFPMHVGKGATWKAVIIMGATMVMCIFTLAVLNRIFQQ